jgi:tRNA nucleotidyltransferase (CCA-adding enzyme)
MKVYLVGGAVRDQLMGYPIKEHDWVVVGATPQDLLQKNFQQVGRDFPVFLHPSSREEYALARTERKRAPGYYGFVCDFNPDVTLEADLARRDLTINAMAKSSSGELIDPFNGQKDLNDKILRHVSPAFAEDPVRVLRVARFAARYHHLGFKLARETRSLMYSMCKSGELNHLVAERVWQEWMRSLSEKNPEIFITTLRDCGALQIILPELDALFGVPNPRTYHPEVDSGMHTLMVLQAASSLSKDPRIRFAAVVHDLGKGVSPMGQWPSHFGHEQAGVKIIRALCERLRIPVNYNKFAQTVSEFHLLIHRFFELRPQTIVSVLEKIDAFRRPQIFGDLLQVCKADQFGKGNRFNEYPQEQAWQEALNQAQQISVNTIIANGFKGEAIRNELHEMRVNCIKRFLENK